MKYIYRLLLFIWEIDFSEVFQNTIYYRNVLNALHDLHRENTFIKVKNSIYGSFIIKNQVKININIFHKSDKVLD